MIIPVLPSPRAVVNGTIRAIGVLLWLSACAGEGVTTKPPALRDLTVVVSPSTLIVGQEVTATASGLDQFGAGFATGSVTWSSSATGIATVSSSGVVMGVAPGTSVVAATVGGIVGRQTITVSAPVLTTIAATAPTTTIMVGQTVTATVAALDQINRSISAGTVTWSTGSTAIATVNASGVVTGVAAGTTPVIATAGGKTGQVAITVSAPPAIRINEVESNGGTPGDWIELYNPTAVTVDLSGWALKDNDSTRTFRFPSGTTIPSGGYLVADEAAFGFGLGAADDARLFNQFGVLVDGHTWTTHAPITYGRCPNGTGAFAATSTSTKGIANDCRPAIRVNEIESNGGTPGDWIELYNAGATPVDVSNFLIKDSDDTRVTRLPIGTMIAPGAFYVVEEAVLGFGLGAADAARIYDADGTLLDAHAWTAHAGITVGRCPDGTGGFAETTASTKGVANVCTPTGPVTNPWPGSDDVATVDGLNVFSTNGSGLTYEAAVGADPAVLWAVRNGPGTLFRMIFSGGIWTPDPGNSWSVGKLLKYADGTGNPDSEGVTFAAGGSAGGMYVATERNNDASSISRNVILRVNPTATGATLIATNQWDIAPDLPVTGANLGIEAITWLPDSMLVANGFFDESKARLYAPADYADHAGGLFLVGVEANGNVYAYALNHTNNTFTRVATFSSGFATLAGGSSIMDLAYDRESGYLWAVCDDSCNGEMRIFEIDRTVGAATRGKFISNRKYARPSTMPNINNEGFTFSPNSECVANRKAVFWADDNETAGHTIRKATMPCGAFAPLVQGITASPTRRR